MASFHKVQIALAKMFRIMKSRIDLIFFFTLLIVLTGLYIWLDIYDPAKTWEIKPLKIQCNDPGINHPMASFWPICLQYVLVGFGIGFCCCTENEFMSTDYLGILSQNARSKNKAIRGRAYFVVFLRWIACFIIGVLTLLIITKSGLFEVLTSKKYFMSRDFLEVCEPNRDRLDRLCGANPKNQHWVEIICKTPFHTWMPAAKSMIPTTLIIYYYLMFTTMFRMCFKWNWKEELGKGLFLVATSIACVALVGLVSVYCCNEGHPLVVFVVCLLILWMAFCWVSIDVLLALIFDDDFPDGEGELPRYWSHALPKNKIPQVGQTPTKLLPPCGNQKPSAKTGPGPSKPAKDSSTDTPQSTSTYPKLPPNGLIRNWFQFTKFIINMPLLNFTVKPDFDSAFKYNSF